MPAQSLNLYFDQYTDYRSTVITWYTGPTANGPFTLVNLTGMSARMMIRNSPTDAAAMVSISTTPNAQGYILLGGAAGTIQPVIYKAVYPAALLTGQQQFDLFIDNADGTTWPDLISGIAYVKPTSVH